ncbi:MAG: right-handed parallel beta-helix repeat-containing protein, partial [Acetobacteraceae bacterium]
MSESGTTSTVGISTTSFPAPANAVVIAAGANIQDAVNEYPPGTAFLLSAGTYSGQTITPLSGDSFYGQTGTVLDGGGVQQAFQGQGISNVTISGLTITNYAPAANGPGTLGTDGSSVNWVVQGCTFTQTSVGVPIMLGTGMTVRDCSIYDNQMAGIGGSNVTGATIENNNIYANNQSLQNPFTATGSTAGIKIVQCTNVQILNNDISNNPSAPGIWTNLGCSGTLIEGNTISGNGGPGIIDELDYGATITNNLIENNNNPALDGFEGGGIYIQTSANANVSGNMLTGNVGGIWLHQSSRGSGRQGPWVVNNDAIFNNVIQMSAGNSGYDSSVSASEVNFYGNSYYLSGSAQLVAGGSAVSSTQWQADGNDTAATGSSFGSGSTVPVSGPSPTAVADTATAEENQAVTIAVLSVDTDPGGTLDPGSVAISTAPADGTATVSATTGAITYTPAAGFYGTDSFQYSVADVSGSRSAPGTVTVTVNGPPVVAANDLAAAVNTPANDPTMTTDLVATSAAETTGSALSTGVALAGFAGFPNEWDPTETAATLAQWNSLTAAMGQAPTMMLTYVNYDDPLSEWVTNDTAWEINSFAAGPWGPGQVIPIVAIPMALAGDNADTDFQAIASGQWDTTLEGMFQAWETAGYKTIDIRPGHEMNGNWYPWSITPQNVADYVAAFQHIASLAHSFAGMTINVVWSPNNGTSTGSIPVSSYYPGNASVDIIGIDEYGPPLGSDSLPDAVSTGPADYTLTAALAMAKSDNKPFALAETGSMDAGFPANLASVVAASGVPVAYVALWDYNSGAENFDWSSNPTVAAAWKQAFATISNADPAAAPPDLNVFTVASAPSISAKAGTAYSGTIATFTDSDTAT